MKKQIYLKDTKIAERYDTHRITIWRWVKEGNFPAPVRLSPGCTRWLLNEIEDWEKDKMISRGKIE